MKKRCLFITVALGMGLILALLWILGVRSLSAVAAPSVGNVEAPNAPAAELHVCPSGCTYSSVQAAVDDASDGDVIKVAAGTYTGVNVRARNDITTTGVVTQVVYISKTVTIRGGYTTTNWTTPHPITQPTTLDAQGQGRVFYITADISPAIKGLRITGGDAAGLGCGGGLYVITATITVSDCLIHDNHAGSGDGGGLYLRRVNGGAISGNTFRANSTTHSGGGLAYDGGGLGLGDVTISSNTFTDNHGSAGGGLWLFGTGSNANLIDNLVSGNSAGGGGGINLGMFAGTLDGNVIISNTASQNGGGILVFGGGPWYNNVVADNYAGGSGSALYVQDGGPNLVHTTIARNSGGDGSAIYVTWHEWTGWYSTMMLTNTILADHSVGISVTGGNTVMVNGVLWHNTPITISQSPTATVAVQNQLTGDPAFAPDGYHLTAGSAAVDKGVDAGVTTDIDGDPRPAPAGTHPDLGADEISQQRVYLPLVIRNYQP